MTSEWGFLSCVLSLAAAALTHISLWLPLVDRRLLRESSPESMSRRAAILVLCATLALHLVWTALTREVLTPTVGALFALMATNVLLAPFCFTAAYGVWLHWRLLRQPDHQPWPKAETAEQEERLPSVTVVIACRNEPFDVVQMTLRSAMRLQYPRHKLAFLLADNSDEDHPDFQALRREVEARQRRGEPIAMLHRRGTRGYKARNLDLALQATRTDLLLVLDVDNTVPEDLLLVHAAPLWRDPKCSFIQCLQIACNGHANLVAATGASIVQYGKQQDLALATFSGWSFFQGHACLWKREDLLKVAPISRFFKGASILTEDLHITFQASKLGLSGRTRWSPSAFWVPTELASLDKMLGRWYMGMLQSYAKDILPILSRSMGYGEVGGYAALWYRLWQPSALWLLPILNVLLPFSTGGAWLLVGLWALTGPLPPLLVMGLRADANVGGVRSGPGDLLRQHLLVLFQAWWHSRAVLLFSSGRSVGWSPTPKAAAEHDAIFSWRDHCGRFQAALLTSLLAPGLTLAWKGLLWGEPLLSPATLLALYLSGGLLAAILLFASPYPAPASYTIERRPLPPWMGRTTTASAAEVD